MTRGTAALRRARHDDVAALARLEKRAYERYRACGMDDLVDAVDMPLGEFERGIAAGTLYVTVSADGEVVGSVLFRFMPDDAPDAAPEAVYVEQLCVAPEAAGQGIGARLLDAVEFAAGARGIMTMALTTFRDIPWNEPYYTRLGWRSVDDDALPRWLANIVSRQRAAGFHRWPRATMTATVRQPVLTAERLRLRGWHSGDEAVVQSVANDSLVPLITTVPTSGGAQDAADFVARQQERLAQGRGYAFAIAETESRPEPDVAVGHLGVWTSEIAKGRVSLGYWLTPSRPGRGLLTEALEVATQWALAQPDVERAELFVEPWNEASWRAAERCGYEREGLLRRRERVGDALKDVYCYSRLSSH